MSLPVRLVVLCPAVLIALVACGATTPPARDAAGETGVRTDGASDGAIRDAATDVTDDSDPVFFGDDADLPPDDATDPADAATPDGSVPWHITVTNVSADNLVFTRANRYDYHPAVMYDGIYRMWWCGQNPAGPYDHVLYAEASDPHGPWHARGSSTPDSFDDVFQPSGAGMATFDARHTCDPKVIRVHGRYYLYYGATPNYQLFDSVVGTWIGLAISDDGFTWRRANGGLPIVAPYDRHCRTASNCYGAGEPSVVYRDGFFYMLYLDTTGHGGAQTYALRSTDPAFQTAVDVLAPSPGHAGEWAWTARTAANNTLTPAVPSGGWDWQYSDALDLWLVARHDVMLFWQGDLARLTDAQPRYTIPAVGRRDHPGLMHRWDGHSLPSRDGTFASRDCGSVPIDFFGGRSPPGGAPATYDLSMMSFDLSTGRDCSAWNLPAIFEGEILARSSTDYSLILGGRRLRFERLGGAQQFANATFNVDTAVYDAVPGLGRTIPAAAPAWTRGTLAAPVGSPAVLATNDASGVRDQKYVYTCASFPAANGSTLAAVSDAQWSSVPAAATLWCTR